MGEAAVRRNYLCWPVCAAAWCLADRIAGGPVRQARKTHRLRTWGTDRSGQIPNMTLITVGLLLEKMEGTVRRAPIAASPRSFGALRQTLTYDRGKEMATHERLAQHLMIRVFFADPHCPWQRGTNENTNGLLRQYLPKGTALSGYTQWELTAIAYRLNTCPTHVSTLPRHWKPMRTCAIIHPLHLELETAHILAYVFEALEQVWEISADRLQGYY